MDADGAVADVADEIEILDGAGIHLLEPYGLPDAGDAGVPDAVGFKVLLADKLILPGRVVNADG